LCAYGSSDDESDWFCCAHAWWTWVLLYETESAQKHIQMCSE
jgi:hypothetical protein